MLAAQLRVAPATVVVVAVTIFAYSAASANGFALAHTPTPPEYGPKRPFGNPVSTQWNQGESSFADDGTMVFCSARADKALAPNDEFDLYISTPDVTGRYSEPENMGPVINSVPDTTGATPRDGDDREPWITHDGNSIYFKSTRLARYESDAPQSVSYNSAGEVLRGIETNIFVTHKVNGVWQPPELLPYPVNTKGGREHCPSLLRDGKTLCFASKRPGGFGGSDIYCAARQEDGSYTEPVNAGPAVNTAADEYHFQQDAKREWIYFSSFRPGGYGVGDIWATRPDGKGGYHTAVNMGRNVNAGRINLFPAFMPNGTLTSIFFRDDGTHDIHVNDPLPV